MLQRKQTIYFLFAGIISIILIFAPLVELKFDGCEYLFTVAGIKSVGQEAVLGISTMPLLILVSVISGINFIVILLFKNRQFQMKLGILNLVLILGFCSLIIFQIASIASDKIEYLWGLLLPVFILFFIILAYKGVRKDEKLVKSLDRIR